jgi:hypothetical protein
MTEETGDAIDPTAPIKTGGGFIMEPTMVQLSPEQLEKIAKAIEAVQDAIDSLGAVGGALAKLLLGKVIEGLRAMGPIPPLGPPLGTVPPTTPPPTTPTP